MKGLLLLGVAWIIGTIIVEIVLGLSDLTGEGGSDE